VLILATEYYLYSYLIWVPNSTEVPTRERKSDTDSLRPDLGSEDSSGLLVSNIAILTADTFVCLLLDHAHPTYIAGHPFKGGWVLSTGQLEHPDLKRFQIETPVLFKPPNPVKDANYQSPAPATPSFANFFSSYFGNASYNLSNANCSKMMTNLKSCYEANPDSADQTCAYYVNGFKRMACSN
jgi:hypothetical protein